MPSFASSAGELRALATAWNKGKRAYRDLFEEIPQEQRSPKVRRRPDVPAPLTEALQACDDQWVRYEARRQTRDAARIIQQRISTQDLPKEEIKALRYQLRRKRSEAAAQLVKSGGMAGAINLATQSKDISAAKNLLVLCLGSYITP